MSLRVLRRDWHTLWNKETELNPFQSSEAGAEISSQYLEISFPWQKLLRCMHFAVANCQ